MHKAISGEHKAQTDCLFKSLGQSKKKKGEEEEKAGNCNLATANMADYREHAQVSQSKWRAKYKLEFLSPVPEVRKP